MDLIDNISAALMILIRAGTAFRVAFCFFKMITVEDEHPQYEKRLKNVLFFYVLAELAFVIKSVVLAYYI